MAMPCIFVTEQDVWQRAKIGRSNDYGKIWTFNNGSFANSSWDFAEAGGAFAAPAFIESGKDSNGALDDFTKTKQGWDFCYYVVIG